MPAIFGKPYTESRIVHCPFGKIEGIKKIPIECVDEMKALEQYNLFFGLTKTYDDFITDKEYKYCNIYGTESGLVHSPKWYGLNEQYLRWTAASYHTPLLKQWIESLDIEIYKASIMRMPPGGFVSWHADTRYSAFEQPEGEITINCAINHPEGSVIEFFGFDPIPFEQGDAYWFRNSEIHCAYNRGSETRYQLLIGRREDMPDYNTGKRFFDSHE